MKKKIQVILIKKDFDKTFEKQKNNFFNMKY